MTDPTQRVPKGWNAVFSSTGVDTFSQTGGYEPPSSMCRVHKLPEPCIACEAELVKANAEAKIRLEELARINETSNRIWAALDVERHAKAWPAGGKCWHGVYLSQFYCGICAIEVVDPDYDRNRFRDEINKALGAAKKNFHAGGYYPGKDKAEVLTEGEKNFQDLLGLVDLEVWRASRHYGEKMNGALAGTIAKNVAGKFTAEIIEDETIITKLEWGVMPSDIRERAFSIFTGVGGDIKEFIRVSRNERLPKEAREFVKGVIHDYGIRAPKFESFDEPTKFADGNSDGDSTSKAEYAIHEQEQKDSRSASMTLLTPATMGEIFDAHREGLEALVKTWRGELKKVGEAMLAGTFNTRGVPGVSRSSASRLYQKVVQAFRAYIASSP